MIAFAHPWFLSLALLLAVIWLGLRRSLARWSARQQAACTLLRILILLLLIGALAGLRVRLPSSELAVVFAVDNSASVSPAAAEQARSFIEAAWRHRRSQDQAGVIAFAGQAEIRQPPAAGAAFAGLGPDLAERSASDLGHALDFGSAIFPPDKNRRLVLLSDGNDTAGNALAAAQHLALAGIELVTVPLRNPPAPEVLVERVDLPRRLKSGEPFDLEARLRSTVATTATVRVYQNQFLILQRDQVALQPGENRFRVPNLKAEGNFISCEVEVVPAADSILENNRAQATASLRGQPRVLLVDGEEARARPLAEALRGQKMEVDLRGPLGLPKTLAELQGFDLFILSDISALQLSGAQMELYRRWVQDFGGGFLLAGGENSFGVGGYFRTPIEQLLPVRMEHEDRQDTPSVALLIVLDRSGSMSAQVQGQTKMALANQGAALALNVLQPRDYFGVTAVDVRPHSVVPLAQHASRAASEQKILAVTAGGGGIYIYTSLAEAFGQLRDNPARIKHVILFSDAADAEEKNGGDMADGSRSGGSSLDLASAMLTSKITTSVVALGQENDKDTAFLRQLAERGSGRFYLTHDPTTLPQIFSTETMKVAQSSLVEEPFQAAPLKPNPLTEGLDWAQSPLLLGYNATKAKPTADLLLATERGEPLLATWRYGLGQAAAFTSDAKSRWAAEWLGWPGYGKFWTQVARGLMRRSDQTGMEITSEEKGDGLHVGIVAITAEGAYRNHLPLTINALAPDGTAFSIAARQSAPGRYEGRVPLPAEGTTLISVSSPALADGGASLGHTRSYPREFLTSETNEALLRALAQAGGGRFAPAPGEIFVRPATMTARWRDLSPWFLMGALLLFPADIWLRRRNWKP